MRRMGVIGLVVALVAAVGSVLAPAQANVVGNEGCTPGYWKNHTDNWLETPTIIIPTTATLGGRGLVPVGHPKAGVTFLEALYYKGGSTLDGAEQILLRAAVAAYLNAAHDEMGYPLQRLDFLPVLREVIRSGDRERILAYAEYLDGLNNSPYGCPLN